MTELSIEALVQLQFLIGGIAVAVSLRQGWR